MVVVKIYQLTRLLSANPVVAVLMNAEARTKVEGASPCVQHATSSRSQEPKSRIHEKGEMATDLASDRIQLLQI